MDAPKLPSQVKAVTLDAYGTLLEFDLKGILLPSAEAIVLAQGLDVAPLALAGAWGKSFAALYEVHVPCGGPFKTTREMSEESFGAALDSLGLEGDRAGATEIWFGHLRRARPFPDAADAVRELSKRFRVAVVSDADDDVLFPAMERSGLQVEAVITSQAERAYKLSPGGGLIARAIERLGLEAADVLHAGDAAADELGARAAGASAVRVCRPGSLGAASGPPEPGCPVVEDLAELVRLLAGRG